jgi:hypothetical protein
MCTVKLKFSHKETQENIVVTLEGIKKIPVLSAYAIYSSFKWMSHFQTISIHEESRMGICSSLVVVLYCIMLFIPMTFEIRFQIIENVDPSIICAFLKVWKVSSWFIDRVFTLCTS